MSFCNERTFFQSPACVARKIRCLRLRTNRWTFRQLTVFQSVGLSGRFALPMARIERVLRLAIVTKNFGWFTWSLSAAFRRGPMTLSTGLWFPRAFRQVAFASGTILHPLRSWVGLAAY